MNPMTIDDINKITVEFPFSRADEQQKQLRKRGFIYENIVFTGNEIETIRIFLSHKFTPFIHPLEMDCDHHPEPVKTKIKSIKNKTAFFTALGYVASDEY